VKVFTFFNGALKSCAQATTQAQCRNVEQRAIGYLTRKQNVSGKLLQIITVNGDQCNLNMAVWPVAGEKRLRYGILG